MTPPPDRFECQPANWSSTPEQDDDDEANEEFGEFERQIQTPKFEKTGMEGQCVVPGVHVMAQVSADLKDRVKRASKDAGLSVSEWLRIIIVKELECG